MNTPSEAVAIVDAIGSPAVQTIFDSHNTAGEKESAVALLRRHMRCIRHVHLNEMDGRRPGADDYDFAAVRAQLKADGYRGWVSSKSLTSPPEGKNIARQSMDVLSQAERELR